VLFFCYLILSTHAALPKHVVVLMMENRSFDHILGWLRTNNTNIDGLTGKESNPYSTKDPNSKRVVVNTNGYDISKFDPGHSFGATSEEVYGVTTVPPSGKGVPQMNGFVQNAYKSHSDPSNVMSMFTSATAPVINSLGVNFAIFDKWFCSIPGPTDPNRAFFMSGTANGMVDNFNGTLWSQQSYFDWLGKRGITWNAYYQEDPWAVMYFQDMHKAPNSQNVHQLTQFFTDVKSGKLAQYTLLQPQSATHKTLPTWQHPDAPVSEGERLYKQIYEALRASSFWNDLVFIITYDEHGGFFDHVAPPQTGVPAPDGVVGHNGFKYDRLGVRIPTVAISPLIPAGTVVHQPPQAQSPFPTSQYESTSIMSTANLIFGIKDHISARAQWSGTFEHIFSLSTPRTDCPTVLPEVPPAPAHLLERQWKLPLNEHLDIQVQFYCKFNNHGADCGKNIKNQYDASVFIAEEAAKFMEKRTGGYIDVDL